jgi:serine/threonine protein kinase
MPMPWQDAARLLIPIARALDFAHRQGMIHRDVKPSNIIITADGDPMLTDFGIAKILDLEETVDLTGTSAAVGTPEYMAPEQSTSNKTDHRADIYALGVVLYEMVVGRKPYIADTPMAVLIKHASEPLPRPRQFAPNLPQAVENVLFKALAKSPEDRYQSMGEFTKALENLSMGMKGGTSSSWNRSAKIWAAGLMGTMLVTLLIIFRFWFGETSPDLLDTSQEIRSEAAPIRISTSPTDPQTATSEGLSNTPPVFLVTTKLELYDDFDNSSFDGSFDERNWWFFPNDGVSGAQNNGVFGINVEKGNKVADASLIVYGERNLSLTNAFEARLGIEQSEGANFGILIKINPKFDYYWHYACWLMSNTSGVRAWCETNESRGGNEKITYRGVSIKVSRGELVPMKLEIDPTNLVIRSYINGEMMDTYDIPAKQEFRNAKYNYVVGLWVDPGTSGRAVVDDAFVGSPVVIESTP